jgi:thiazole synthase ThiGH ThiG subunit
MTESDENQDQLTPRQVAALPYFAANASVEAACGAADISRETYYKWLKNPVFKLELDRLRNQIVNDAVNQLKATTVKAAATLSLLLDRDDNPSVQRAAANDILNHVGRFKELQDLQERIEKLESLNR